MRLSVKAALAGMIAIVAGLGVVTPAEASPGQGLVAASTAYLDEDWNDEGEVSRYSYSYSGATGLWQAVLWADGAIERDGSTFDATDIDCEFGPNTEAATKSWQSTTGGLAVDGKAGPRTWGSADGNLRFYDEWPDGTWIVEYVGRYRGRSFFVAVNSLADGQWWSGGYWTSAWGGSYFWYGSKPSACSGVPYVDF